MVGPKLAAACLLPQIAACAAARILRVEIQRCRPRRRWQSYSMLSCEI
eukprot:SAG22_NODE_666_length_8013_cov_2.524640_3_plen_48_part_00